MKLIKPVPTPQVTPLNPTQLKQVVGGIKGGIRVLTSPGDGSGGSYGSP